MWRRSCRGRERVVFSSAGYMGRDPGKSHKMELIGGILFFTLAIACSSLKFVIEHERLVVYRMGRAIGVRGPGPVFLLPLVDRFMKVDLRQTSINIPVKLISADNVAIELNAICIVQVEDPCQICTAVEDPFDALAKLLTTVLRNNVGSMQSSVVVSKVEKITESALGHVDSETRKWGLRVKSLQLHNLEFKKGSGIASEYSPIVAATTGAASSLKDDSSIKGGAAIGSGAAASKSGPLMDVSTRPVQVASVPGNGADSLVDVGINQRQLVAAGNAVRQTTGTHSSNVMPPGSTQQANAAKRASDTPQASVVPEPIGWAQAGYVLPANESNAQSPPARDGVAGSHQVSASLSTDISQSNSYISNSPIHSAASESSSLYKGSETTNTIPTFAMPIINAAGFEGLEAIFGYPPIQTQTAEIDGAADTAPSSRAASLSSDLTAAVTGHSGANCKKCEAPLEGLLCFLCWELN